MVQLLESPTEVLESILDKALPEGFDSIFITCKSFYSILIPKLRLYKC